MRIKRDLGIALVILFVATSCTNSPTDDRQIVITYTEVQGDQTSFILEALNPMEILSQIEIRPMPVPTDLLNIEPYVLSLSTASAAIDAYLLDTPWVKRYSETNWLAPINQGTREFDLSGFRRELIDVTSIGEGENRKVLAVPFETKGNLLFYRKDLLDDFGFEAPETWDQLFSQCLQILNTMGAKGPRFGFLFHGELIVNDFYPIIWGFNGGVFDENGKVTVNRPENVRALAMVKRMLGTISPTAREMIDLGILDDYKAIDRLFAAGDAIFMINWNIRWGDLERGVDGQTISVDQVGVAPIPSEEGNPHYSNIGSFGWGINYFSHNPDEAMLLIEALTSYEAQRWRAINNGIIPARMDVLDDPELQSTSPAVLKIARVFEKLVLRARPFQREINNILDSALIQALIDDLDPLEKLTAAQRDIEAELAWVERSRAGVVR